MKVRIRYVSLPSLRRWCNQQGCRLYFNNIMHLDNKEVEVSTRLDWSIGVDELSKLPQVGLDLSRDYLQSQSFL